MLNLIEVEVLSILRYCRISGTVINRSAGKNRKPKYIMYQADGWGFIKEIEIESKFMYLAFQTKFLDTIDDKHTK